MAQMGKKSACNAGDLGLIPKSGRSPGEENGYRLQYSCLEELHEQRSLVGYSLCGHKSDMTEQVTHTHTHTLKSPLDCKEIKPVNPKGNQSSIFIGRTDAEAEAPKLWPPDTKS